MASQVHVNPRFRAYGKARLDIARRASTRAEWEDLWKPAQFNFPFAWGRYWKQCIEYRVEDFAAEVGFYIDILGFPVNAFDPDYAQFTSPDGEFFIAVVPTYGELQVTPPEAITLQFMITHLAETVADLEKRGVSFDQEPGPLQPGSRMMLASFHTPHGVRIELWGEQSPLPVSPKPVQKKARPVENPPTIHKLPTVMADATPEKLPAESTNDESSEVSSASGTQHPRSPVNGGRGDDVASTTGRNIPPSSRPKNTASQSHGSKDSQPPRFFPTTAITRPANNKSSLATGRQEKPSEPPGSDPKLPGQTTGVNQPTTGLQSHPGATQQPVRQPGLENIPEPDYNPDSPGTDKFLAGKKRSYKVAETKPLLLRNSN